MEKKKMTRYTQEQKKLERCFYVLRNGKELHPTPRRGRANTTTTWDDKPLSPSDREKRIALLGAFYSSPLAELEELSPFEGGRLIADPTIPGGLSAPSPKKNYEPLSFSLTSPASEGSDD